MGVPSSFRQGLNRFRVSILLLAVLICLPVPLSAQVVTDGTVGPAQSLTGPDYRIPETLGTTAGQNLFHSFHQFSIFQNESATFTGPDAIANVISRVTGGDASTIDGLLRSEVGRADFFFINPAGVMFGPNARVDVPAAFHVSTADALRFEDGTLFSASDPDASTLSVAEPSAFGYLSPQSGDIVLNGSRLELVSESTVSLNGSDVRISGTEAQEAELTTEGGEIRIAAIGDGVGDVPLGEPSSVDMSGTALLQNAEISSSGDGGGHIRVEAGNMGVIAAIIAADNTGPTDARGVMPGAALTST